MKRIFALLAIAFAALLATTAPAKAQYGATPNVYGLTGAFTNITTTGFTLQLNATPGFPSGQPFEIFYDLTAVPQCGNAFVDIPGNTGMLTGSGSPFSQTINVTFPTPLTGGYVFYGNILLGTKGTVVAVPFPSIGGTGQLSASVPSNCTPGTPPMLTCGSVTTGTVNVAFNSGPLNVTGGTAPYTFSIGSGTLPAGLSLNPMTGAVTGTPTASGTFTISVTDSKGVVGTTSCAITINPGGPPGLTLIKTASPTSIQPYQLVTYTYTVKNTGGTTLTNIVVVDDDGTPNDPSDDHTVTIPSLAAGASQSFTWVTYPPVTLTVIDQKLGTIPGGTMTVQNVTDGTCTPNVNCNLKFSFNQSLGLNDNSYGSTTSAGWGNQGHKFQDLTGSDEATWEFYDSTGTSVLYFSQDYISQASAPSSLCPNANFMTYGSGYGTLGWCSGDGKFMSGDKTKIVSQNSTLTDDMNQSPAFYGFTTNSPAQGTTGWNFVDGYSVILNPAIFGTAGFGSVQIPEVHNSPSKNGTDQVCEMPSESVSTNTATATANGGMKTTATATVTILAGPTVCQQKGGGGAPPNSPVKLQFPNGPSANGTVGTPYSSTFIATGGTAPYTYTITSGSLPPGLKLNATNGAVTGTPTTQGNFQLSAQVVDASHNIGTANGNINIQAPQPLHLQFPNGPSANGKVGTSYSGSFTATGGIPPYMFSISSGMLPPGLTLNPSTGAVTGTPTVAVNETVTAKVTDSTGASTTQNGNINIGK